MRQALAASTPALFPGALNGTALNATMRAYLRELMRRRRSIRWPTDDRRLLVCPLEGCEVKMRHRTCPSHCTNASCPNRGKRAPLLPYVRRVLRVVDSLRPPHPPPERGGARALLLITTTFPHDEQLIRLRQCARVIEGEPNVTWIVVEDAATRSARVAALLARCGVRYEHLAYGPTRRGGNAQRNLALKFIRDRSLEGVVYNLDDDNGYHPRLWNELRRVGRGRVGVIAVRRGVYPPPRCDGRFLPLLMGQRRTILIERPLYDNVTGAFVRFEAGWCKKRSWMVRKYGARKFCVDMGGFAFDAALLQKLHGEIWEYEVRSTPNAARCPYT